MDLTHLFDLSLLESNEILELDHDRNKRLSLNLREISALKVFYAEAPELFQIFYLQSTCHEQV